VYQDATKHIGIADKRCILHTKSGDIEDWVWINNKETEWCLTSTPQNEVIEIGEYITYQGIKREIVDKRFLGRQRILSLITNKEHNIKKGKLMKIKLLATLASADGCYGAGSIIDVEEHRAWNLIQNKYAEFADPKDAFHPDYKDIEALPASVQVRESRADQLETAKQTTRRRKITKKADIE